MSPHAVKTALGVASLTQTASGQGGSGTSTTPTTPTTSTTATTTTPKATPKPSGTITVTSDTGDCRGVKGTGTIRGTSQDGLTSAPTEKLTLAFPPVVG
ncbi:MAG TPA: hypothetical protein VNA28_14340 [Solirubrobacteraceae bacterium]|nr:hypothetical protein [Solirubrobacteraceae bacterium]